MQPYAGLTADNAIFSTPDKSAYPCGLHSGLPMHVSASTPTGLMFASTEIAYVLWRASPGAAQRLIGD